MNSTHRIVSVFPFSVPSPLYFLCSFFLASPLLITLSPSFSPCSLSSFLLPFSFLSFHSYLTHFLPHPTLSNNIAFSHFGIINALLAFFFAFSLLSLPFSPSWISASSGAQLPLPALAPAEGNSGFFLLTVEGGQCPTPNSVLS